MNNGDTMLSEDACNKLKELNKLVKELVKSNWHPSPEFWEKEAKAVAKLQEQFEKERKAHQMTQEQYTRPFDI